MIIRKMTEKDALQHEMVASQAFAYTFQPGQPQKLPSDFFLGCFAEDNHTLLGEIQCDYYWGHYCGQKLSCAAVSGVATKPEYRHRRVIRSLFEFLFENNREYAYDYSVLYPFSETYYEKFGYINAGFTLRAELPMALLSPFSVNTCVWLYEGRESERLYEVYNAWAKQYDFGFVRNNPHYFSENPYGTAKYTYIYNETGTDDGFVTLSLNRTGGQLLIHEIGFLNQRALEGLIGFMRVFAGDCQTVIFEKLPQDTPVLKLLTEYHSMKLSLHPMGAIRVMNMQSILAKTQFPIQNGGFTFLCNDSVPENNGCFRLQVSNGRASLEKTAPRRCDLELSATALSELFLLGAPNTLDELQYGKGFVLNCQNPDILSLFPKRHIYFSDSF